MRYDHIIVGAGSAGGVLAARLSEDSSRSILLLEAGPDYPDLASMPEELKHGTYSASGERRYLRSVTGHPVSLMFSKHNWRYFGKATEKAQPMPVPRGKVVGGSSAINQAGWNWGIPEDYDSWAASGNAEWSFDRLLPCFRKLETDMDFKGGIHGENGPVIVQRPPKDGWDQGVRAFHSACVAMGFPATSDHSDPESTGVGPGATNNYGNIRQSTAVCYLSQARKRPNLTIRADCLVRRILFERERATGVVVEESGGTTFAVEGEEIILSAGAIGSPQLLMLSGVGPGEHLGRLGIPVVLDVPGIGRNLKDHPKVFMTWRNRDGLHLKGSRALLLRYTAKGSQFRNDMSILMTSAAAPIVYAREGADASEFQKDTIELLGVQMAACLVKPASKGVMRLSSSDPHAKPILDYNFLSDPNDIIRMREAVHLCKELADHRDMRAIIEARISPTDAQMRSSADLDDWIARNVVTFSHVCGTCKMGPSSDRTAVVDQYGKVHGLDGLRVVDASIMPDLVRAAINPTVMAIGERMADLIKQGH